MSAVTNEGHEKNQWSGPSRVGFSQMSRASPGRYICRGENTCQRKHRGQHSRRVLDESVRPEAQESKSALLSLQFVPVLESQCLSECKPGVASGSSTPRNAPIIMLTIQFQRTGAIPGSEGELPPP